MLGSFPGSSGKVNNCATGSPKFQLKIGHTKGFTLVVVVSRVTSEVDDDISLLPASLVALIATKSPTSKNPLAS